MWETCLPRLRWTLQHSLHINTPLLMEAHCGSGGKGKAAESGGRERGGEKEVGEEDELGR